MLESGCDDQRTCFLLNDTDVMYESFLEDVNSLLNTGTISQNNFYAKVDLDRMADSLTALMEQRPNTSVYSLFQECMRANFHIVLSFSPVGDQLRHRCRMFPSLVNCCTLVWFSQWPSSALQSVVSHFIPSMPSKLVELFPYVHKAVEQAAESFWT